MDGIIDSHVCLGEEDYLKLDYGLLNTMDEAGVAIAIARPMGAELVVDNRAGNDRCLNGGPRIKALATINPWYGHRAIEELQRCRDRGAVGLYLHPSRQGFTPTDPIANPVVAFANHAHWPVVIHTGRYIQSDVLAVAELARRFPQTTFVADQAGFTDMWFELPGVMADVPNIVLCASLIWSKAIANTVAAGRADRILFGSGEPRDRLPAALARIERLELSESHKLLILRDNARRVFNLP